MERFLFSLARFRNKKPPLPDESNQPKSRRVRATTTWAVLDYISTKKSGQHWPTNQPTDSSIDENYFFHWGIRTRIRFFSFVISSKIFEKQPTRRQTNFHERVLVFFLFGC